MKQSQNNTALLLIDVQKGFQDPIWGMRNNFMAEENIQLLLQFFREASAPVIHIQHLSTEPASPLRPNQLGVEFMDGFQPKSNEKVFHKKVHSAFIGTDLERYLRDQMIQFLTMVGFTSDHCVSTSARMAADLDFDVTVVSDATVAFQRIGITGKIFCPDLIHEVSMASLSKEFATITSTQHIFGSSVAMSPSNI